MRDLKVQEWETYLNFKTCGDDELVKMLRFGKDFCCDVRDGGFPRWLSILGTTGTGKTHMAKQIWKRLWLRFNWTGTCFNPGRIYWPDFISQLRGGTAYDKYDEMKRWPILFLDDIGAERDMTGFASDKLNELMGCRIDKWTLITSNLLLEQLGGIDPRMSDRIIRKPNMFLEVSTVSYSLRNASREKPRNPHAD